MLPKNKGNKIESHIVKNGAAKEWNEFLLSNLKDANVLLVTNQTNGSQLKETVPPILDDQAQLLGVDLPFIDSTNEKKILQKLKKRFAVVLSSGIIITKGKTLEDAYIAAQLVEKTAKAWLLAKHIGGAKSINRIEAWLMHKFYMLKYSKESEKNK